MTHGVVRPSGSVKVNVHTMVHETFNKHPSGLVSRKRGMFIRHLNGILADNRAVNLVECHPYDAFTHPDWEVDWKMSLTKQEVSLWRKIWACLRKCTSGLMATGVTTRFEEE